MYAVCINSNWKREPWKCEPFSLSQSKTFAWHKKKTRYARDLNGLTIVEKLSKHDVEAWHGFAWKVYRIMWYGEHLFEKSVWKSAPKMRSKRREEFSSSLDWAHFNTKLFQGLTWMFVHYIDFCIRYIFHHSREFKENIRALFITQSLKSLCAMITIERTVIV